MHEEEFSQEHSSGTEGQPAVDYKIPELMTLSDNPLQEKDRLGQVEANVTDAMRNEQSFVLDIADIDQVRDMLRLPDGYTSDQLEVSMDTARLCFRKWSRPENQLALTETLSRFSLQLSLEAYMDQEASDKREQSLRIERKTIQLIESQELSDEALRDYLADHHHVRDLLELPGEFSPEELRQRLTAAEKGARAIALKQQQRFYVLWDMIMKAPNLLSRPIPERAAEPGPAIQEKAPEEPAGLVENGIPQDEEETVDRIEDRHEEERLRLVESNALRLAKTPEADLQRLHDHTYLQQLLSLPPGYTQTQLEASIASAQKAITSRWTIHQNFVALRTALQKAESGLLAEARIAQVREDLQGM